MRTMALLAQQAAEFFIRTSDHDSSTGNPTARNQLTFQNRHCRCVSLRVAQADEHRPCAAELQKLLARFMQNHEGFAALFAAHLHVVPTQLSANARSESFGDSFLGREP